MKDFIAEFKSFLIQVKRMHFSEFLSCDITNTEYVILDIISSKTASGERDSIWVSEITDEVIVTAQAVSKCLRILENKGYIERFVNEKDRRMTGVRLLKQGKKVYHKAQDEIKDFMEMLGLEFSENERKEFVRLLIKFRKAFMENAIQKVRQKQMNGGQ